MAVGVVDMHGGYKRAIIESIGYITKFISKFFADFDSLMVVRIHCNMQTLRSGCFGADT